MRPGREISISKKHMAELAEHAERAGALESCALLLGAKGAVRDVFFADNVDPRPEQFFSMAPDQLLGAYRAAEKRGLEVIGIFHSHPASGAAPSDTDMRFMRTNPVVWVIYSGQTKEFRAHVTPEGGGGGTETVAVIVAAAGASEAGAEEQKGVR
ncbi:MAG: M67 family metallopeptidase [Thaumarchaeota archaeon]|nr:M67 family metallopeptidase [Nitrososphaerota archaeon]MDE0525621.1 M67 family metallopeptidase [Nitrososphaerota archaeon]